MPLEWTYSDFQTFCPLLASVPEPTFDLFAAEASNRVSRDAFGPMRTKIAGCLMTGHLMQAFGVTGTIAPGPVASEGVGAVRAAYAVHAAQAGSLRSTAYGAAFADMARLCGAGGRTATSCEPGDLGSLAEWDGSLR